MAKTKGMKPSQSAYFKQLFADSPDLLRSISNEEIFDRWKSDHPGAHLTDKVRGILSNVKSIMRKQFGIRGRRRRRRRADIDPSAQSAPRTRISTGTLETLESRIDEVLALARTHEPS